MEVFRQTTSYVFLSSILICTLDLLLPLQAKLLLLTVLLLGFLLLGMISSTRCEVFLSALLVVLILRQVEPNRLLWWRIRPTLFIIVACKRKATLLPWILFGFLLIIFKSWLSALRISCIGLSPRLNWVIDWVVSTCPSLPLTGNSQLFAEPVPDSEIFHHHLSIYFFDKLF